MRLRAVHERKRHPGSFEPHARRSGLTDPWQPIYARRTASEIRLGFRGAAAHANSRGFIHGGLILALADNAMGLSCGQHLPDIFRPGHSQSQHRLRRQRQAWPMDRNPARGHQDRGSRFVSRALSLWLTSQSARGRAASSRLRGGDSRAGEGSAKENENLLGIRSCQTDSRVCCAMIDSMKIIGNAKHRKSDKPNPARGKAKRKGLTIGLAGFEKVSAIEGLRLTRSMKRTFAALERRGASVAEGRAAIPRGTAEHPNPVDI